MRFNASKREGDLISVSDKTRSVSCIGLFGFCEVVLIMT